MSIHRFDSVHKIPLYVAEIHCFNHVGCLFYQQAEDKLAQDIPAIPVYHYVLVQLVKPYVGG
ncbi:hypothetical protein EHN07_20055 [Buttiauxella warmboldiae]|uniref:Uncharacterized protein n=1 Tax=Buttiauxella warmboldiae TaxID=82993 RepID=A0A3N5D3G3_9ENTR|nr:hypothetical protein EHN07_20055 [Buttiauxella warmboldiae]